MTQFVRQVEVVHWAVTFCAVIASVGIWLVFQKTLPPQVPLFYSLPWGERQLVAPAWLFMLPVLAVVMGVGLGLTVPRFVRDSILTAMVLLTSTISQFILVLSLLRIVLLVS